MTPKEAQAQYEAQWPALNATKEPLRHLKKLSVVDNALSALSKRYEARFELRPENNELVQLLGWYDGDQLFFLREGVEPKWPSRRVPKEDKVIEVLL